MGRVFSGINIDIDHRSLGLFRILLGIALLWDLLRYKSGLFHVLLSPEHAMFSTARMHEFFGLPAFSIFDVLGSPVPVKIFLILAGLVYALFTIGYRSRIFSVLAFFFFWNLAQRTSVFYNPAEMLTGCLLFFGMFLPLDRALAVRRPSSGSGMSYLASPFTFLILFQIALVYIMSALVRMDPELIGGQLMINYFSDIIYLRPRPHLVRWLMKMGETVIILDILLCLAIPLGIFLKKGSGKGRWLAISVLGLLALIKLYGTRSGNHFLVSLAMMAILIPPNAWKRTHLFGVSEEPPGAHSRNRSGWKIAAALIFGWLMIHQNASTLADRGDGPVAAFMKKVRITKALKLTRLPHVERASFYQQDWVRQMPTVPGRYGRFKAEGNKTGPGRGSITNTIRFRNYTASGMAVWRNEMHKNDIYSLLSDWVDYETLSTGGRQPAIFYESSPIRSLMFGRHNEWSVSDWTPPLNLYAYKGPVRPLTSGYGAAGPYKHRILWKEHHGYPLMIYAPITEKPVPVVLFTHAFYGHNYQIYHSLMERVASWGYAFAFVPYRAGRLNKDAEDRRVRNADVWEGFNDVMTAFPTVIDPKRVVVAGHSFGGGAAASLAVKIFSETSWGSKAGGVAYFCPGYMEGIHQSDLKSLRDDLKLLAQVYENDTVTDAGMAWDFYEHAGMADSNKLFLVVEPDEVEGHPYFANHYVPLQIGPNQYYDAYDQYAVFRPFHAFLRSVFAEDQDAYEFLYDRTANEVLYMGPKLKAMRRMTEYEPLQEKDWYWAPCDHPGNPRREFCP